MKVLNPNPTCVEQEQSPAVHGSSYLYFYTQYFKYIKVKRIDFESIIESEDLPINRFWISNRFPSPNCDVQFTVVKQNCSSSNCPEDHHW